VLLDQPGLFYCDRTAFLSSFGRTPVRFQHGLGDHPLLTVGAVGRLSGRWPTSLTEHHLADLPLLLPLGDPPRLRASAADVAANIEDNGCWMILWEVNRDPSYEALVRSFMEPVTSLVGRREGGVNRLNPSLLLASPGGVVPAHFDRDHVFLFQVEGTKRVTVGRFDDPQVAQRAIERDFSEEKLNLDVLPSTLGEFELGPGDGLYLPPYAFHWVNGGPAVSVAVSCSCHTAETERTHVVHACNTRLRRLGLSPRPAGTSRSTDLIKASVLGRWWQVRRAASQMLARSAATARHGLRRSEAPRRKSRSGDSLAR
jgi:hypothetical protein